MKATIMKPHITCHMLSPLDGRLLVQLWAPEGSVFNQQMIDEYERIHDAFEADAWLSGTHTMTEFATGKPAPRPGQRVERPWHLADSTARHFAIAIDRKGELHWAAPIADKGHVVVILGESVPDSHLAELGAAGVSYLVMPGDEIDLAAMLEELNNRLGIKRVLLEGGATMNGAFLKAGLVDEISLLLCPAIAGNSGAAAIFEAGEEGMGQRYRLELQSSKPGVHGTVHLRYLLQENRHSDLDR